MVADALCGSVPMITRPMPPPRPQNSDVDRRGRAPLLRAWADPSSATPRHLDARRDRRPCKSHASRAGSRKASAPAEHPTRASYDPGRTGRQQVAAERAFALQPRPATWTPGGTAEHVRATPAGRAAAKRAPPPSTQPEPRTTRAEQEDNK